jgi:hypothetical protein
MALELAWQGVEDLPIIDQDLKVLYVLSVDEGEESGGSVDMGTHVILLNKINPGSP